MNHAPAHSNSIRDMSCLNNEHGYETVFIMLVKNIYKDNMLYCIELLYCNHDHPEPNSLVRVLVVYTMVSCTLKRLNLANYFFIHGFFISYYAQVSRR